MMRTMNTIPMIIQDQLLKENAVTDSRTEFINYELVIIITIQDNTIHFEMLSLLQSLYNSQYLSS